MGRVFDFLFWWFVEPRDDWPHLRFVLLLLLAFLLIMSSLVIVEDLRNPHAKRQAWLQPAHPGRVIAMYLAGGLAAGAVASLVLTKPPVAPSAAHYASLAIVPLIVAVLACGVSHLRRPARSYSPRLVFWQYFALTAGLLAMRLAL